MDSRQREKVPGVSVCARKGNSVTTTQPTETYLPPSSDGRDEGGGREQEGELTR